MAVRQFTLSGLMLAMLLLSVLLALDHWTGTKYLFATLGAGSGIGIGCALHSIPLRARNVILGSAVGSGLAHVIVGAVTAGVSLTRRAGYTAASLPYDLASFVAWGIAAGLAIGLLAAVWVWVMTDDMYGP